MLKNGLSMVAAGKTFGNYPYYLLALNGEIIPGQIALEYEPPNKWGVSHVHVIFEIQEDKNDESRENRNIVGRV